MYQTCTKKSSFQFTTWFLFYRSIHPIYSIKTFRSYHSSSFYTQPLAPVLEAWGGGTPVEDSLVCVKGFIMLRQLLPHLSLPMLINVTASQPNDWKDITWDCFVWLLHQIVTSDSYCINSLDLYCVSVFRYDSYTLVLQCHKGCYRSLAW